MEWVDVSDTLKVGTDCGGLETPIMALNNLGINHEHDFSSEVGESVRNFAK